MREQVSRTRQQVREDHVLEERVAGLFPVDFVQDMCFERIRGEPGQVRLWQMYPVARWRARRHAEELRYAFVFSWVGMMRHVRESNGEPVPLMQYFEPTFATPATVGVSLESWIDTFSISLREKGHLTNQQARGVYRLFAGCVRNRIRVEGLLRLSHGVVIEPDADFYVLR